MPDIFIPADKKIEQEKKIKHDAWEEEHPVMLHGEDVLTELRKGSKKKELITAALKSPSDQSNGKYTIISSPIGPFSAFKVKPKGIKYHEQDEGEQILLILRKHFVTNVPWIILGIILILFPFLLFYLFNFTNLLSGFLLSMQTIIVLTFSYYLVVFCFLFVSYITWYYNADLITNKKIVDIHFQDIIYHHVSITKLNLIEDVNYVQSGFFASFFGYGDVFVETAGKTLTFSFMCVPNPERVVNLVEILIGGVHAE